MNKKILATIIILSILLSALIIISIKKSEEIKIIKYPGEDLSNRENIICEEQFIEGEFGAIEYKINDTLTIYAPDEEFINKYISGLPGFAFESHSPIPTGAFRGYYVVNPIQDTNKLRNLENFNICTTGECKRQLELVIDKILKYNGDNIIICKRK